MSGPVAVGYPVSLSLSGRRAVVVGGGRVATRRVPDLLAQGASVVVVAPELSDELEGRAAAGEVRLERRSFEDGDLDGTWVAFAATDDPAVNRRVMEAAADRRCFASSADGAPASMAPMAVVRRGSLEVAVGTSGRVPGLAAALARRLGTELGPEYGVLCALASGLRHERKAAGQGVAGPDWPAVFDSGILDSIRTGNLDEAREGLRNTCHSSSSG
ncbi:MAG: precorrin-2 dehydrogenase/sirohydrochlorin ferrochelatase family protein [Acidimicrobiales bacterium]